jgi:hypothetical protein
MHKATVVQAQFVRFCFGRATFRIRTTTTTTTRKVAQPAADQKVTDMGTKGCFFSQPLPDLQNAFLLLNTWEKNKNKQQKRRAGAHAPECTAPA